MKQFSYVALDGRGWETKGLLDAEDSAEALGRLKQMGFFPTKVTQQAEAKSDRSPSRREARPAARRSGLHRSLHLPGMGGRVKPKVMALFTRQLATLLDAGMPLVRGLFLLEEQAPQPVLKEVVRKLAQSIEGGSTFSEALACHPKVFPPLYVSMAKAGECSGALDVVLDRLASYMEKAEKIKGKVISAMFYPVAVLCVAVAIMGGLMVFVIPKFREIFLDLLNGQPLPMFTEMVLGVSMAIKNHLPAVLVIVAALVIGFRLLIRTAAGRRALDLLKLRVPLFGPILRKAAVSRFSRTLGTLVNSGVPILQALTIVKETAGNVIVGEAVEAVHRSVKEGETIAMPLRTSGVFPAMVVGMVDIGEQTGALPDMLMRIADNYDDEVDNAVASMTSLLEPIMIVILAVLVGCIVIALFLPMIDIINQVGDLPKDPTEGH